MVVMPTVVTQTARGAEATPIVWRTHTAVAVVTNDRTEDVSQFAYQTGQVSYQRLDVRIRRPTWVRPRSAGSLHEAGIPRTKHGVLVHWWVRRRPNAAGGARSTRRIIKRTERTCSA